MYLSVKKFEGGKPIVFGLNTMRTPYGVVLKASLLQADSEGRKTSPEGSFIVDIDGVIRFLPRAKVASAAAGGATSITVNTPNNAFAVGDVLYMYGVTKVALSGSITSGAVLSLAINGDIYATTSANTTLTALATLFVTNHASALLAKGITVTASGASLVFVGDVSIEGESSTGDTIVNVNGGMSMTAIGSIQSISAQNANKQRVITLAAPAVVAVPLGAAVGPKINKYLGIYPDPLDLTDEPVRHIAPIVEADGVYELNLPYVDSHIKAALPDLRINKKFYK